jgi:hypothetical protein
MVARPGGYQASFNAGELAPNVWGRSEIKQFYSGASLMQNAEPVPQGGFDALPGSIDTGYVRGALTTEGGTQVLTLGPHSAPAVLATRTLGSAVQLGVADVTGLGVSAGFTGTLVIEASNGGATWTQLGATLTATTTARTRRRGVAPAQTLLADRVRLRLATITAGAPATFSLTSLTMSSESTTLPAAARSFEFTYAIDKAFSIVLTPLHADLYEGDTWIGCCATALSAVQLPDVKREQRLDTMYLCHPDRAPLRIMRRDSDGDWSSEDAPFTTLPNVDYGGVYGNIVNDVWNITIRWSVGPADLALELTVNGEDTQAVTLAAGPDWALFLTNLKTAIEALPSVEPGITVTQTLAANSSVVTVTFAGAGNTGNRFTMAARINNVTTAAANVSHPVFGDPGGEAIMSVTRGWPVTAAFYQDRLYLAGFRSEPGALLGSVSGEYLDLNTKIESASGGILVRLDTSGAERIEHLVRSRHLVIFTNEAEYYITDRAIVRTTAPNVAESTRNGINPQIRPVENEGGLIYVNRSRSLIYAAAYSDVSQKYDSEPLSLLASHLAVGLKAMAIQRSSTSTDAARLYVVRDDGLLVVGIMIRNQEVTAFTRWLTDGLVRDVSVDGAGRPFVLVERTIGGVQRLLRERLDSDAVLHQQRSITLGVASQTVTGLADYEGATIWCSADGYFDKSYVVTGGQITLAYPATQLVLGRWTPPRVRTLPLPRLVGERTQLARPVRVHTVRCRLAGSTSIAVGANGQAARDVALVKAGVPSDQPVPPNFDAIAVTGLAGYSDEGFVEFTQTRPGKFAVRDITLEARS